MWTYHQSSGQLFYGSVLVGQGYAGMGAHKNVPADQSIVGLGPLPRNAYTIGPAHTDPHDPVTEKLGPNAMQLTPNLFGEMFGRSGFFMHPDSISHPGAASEGCIVMPHAALIAVSIHPDKRLQVVE